MLTRRFGKTDLQIPVFSCGGMRYQHSWENLPLSEVPAANQKNLEATIRRSLELGINHVETARMYGSSEIQLGQVLPNLPREELIIQTKVAPFDTPEEFEKTLEESFDKLQLDHIELFSFHGINKQEHLDWIEGHCYDIVQKWRNKGRIHHVGFSTHAPCDLIVKAIRTKLFDYVNLHWYYFNQFNEAAVQAAHEKDMGVFIISPSDKGGRLYEPPPILEELCAPLNPMQFNDLFCLQDPRIHTLSLGASRSTDFDCHVEALKHIDNTDLIQDIAQKIETELRSKLGDQWYESWHIGLPNYKDAPNGITVFEIIRLYNLAYGLDMVEFGKSRYQLLDGVKGHWFPGEKAHNVETEAWLKALNKHHDPEQVIKALQWAHTHLNVENQS